MTTSRVGQWWFAPLQAGSTTTSGLRTLLMGAHLKPAEMFVREVTQNSVDARMPALTSTVEMTFHVGSLLPSQHKHLRTFLLGNGTLLKHADAMETPAGPDPEAVALRGFASEFGQTRVLRVEDFGTRGLGGVVGGNGNEDHFSRLVYFFGQSHELGSTAGGAFGFGKSVYSVASAVRTVVYYSRPADGRPSRLIAVSLLPGHLLDGQQFLGYALCGRISNSSSFPVHPLEGEDADDLAAAIGMTRRTSSTCGTSLMVIDCDYTADDLRLALEKWWWPRLVHSGPDGLIARFSEDGLQLPAPNPIKNPQLAPFVQAYRHLLDGAIDTPDVKTDLVRSTGKRIIGRVVLKRVDLDPSDVEDDDPWFVSTVAMFRGPRLVVRYALLGAPSRTPFVGVFTAERFMDGVLRRSENPSHSDWDPESSRLEDDSNERTFVAAVERRCKALARNFQESFESRPIQTTSRMHVLQELLGRLLLQGSTPGALPPAPPRPVAISVQERRIVERGIDQATVEVSARHPGEELPARLQVSAHLLGDAHRTSIGQLPVELFDAQDHRLAVGTTAEHAFDVPQEGKIRFVARARSPIDSPVKFVVTVMGRDA